MAKISIQKRVEKLQRDVEMIKDILPSVKALINEFNDVKELEMELGIANPKETRVVADELGEIKAKVKELEKLEESVFNIREAMEEIENMMESVKAAIAQNRKEIEIIAANIDTETNVERLEKEIKEINDTVIDMASKNADKWDSIENKLDKTTEKISELEIFEREARTVGLGHIGNQNVPPISKIPAKINLSPVYRRISELEKKIETLLASSPYVIE